MSQVYSIKYVDFCKKPSDNMKMNIFLNIVQFQFCDLFLFISPV